MSRIARKIKLSVDGKVLPKPRYRSLRELDRYRKLCLWLPVTIASKKLPWGYYQDPADIKKCLPDEKARLFFLKARDYLRNHSYKEVCEWFASGGFPLGDDGLKKMLKDRPYWPEVELSYEERLKL